MPKLIEEEVLMIYLLLSRKLHDRIKGMRFSMYFNSISMRRVLLNLPINLHKDSASSLRKLKLSPFIY